MTKNPVIPFLLIIFLGVGLVFLLSSHGASEEGSEDVASEEAASGEESGGEASTGDFDAEGFARDNCASCHGEDYTGGMGPQVAGLDTESIVSAVREGPGAMPNFSADQISDEELDSLATYLSEQ